MKNNLISKPLLFLFCATMSGCVTTHNKENQSLTNPEIPKQAPSILPTNPPAVTPETQCQTCPIKKMTEEQFAIEKTFMEQNCDSVLDHAKKLEDLTDSVSIEDQPPIIQAAVYSCDAKAGLNDPDRIKKAISNLKNLTLIYPVFNEPWYHNTLSDLYTSIGDLQNALTEKKTARDLLLGQQQDITTLNIQISKLDPTANKNNQLPENTSGQTVDQIMASATQLINNDSPEQAISLLDTIPIAQRTDQTKRIHTEATNNLVTNLRFKVRALFVRSTEQTGNARKESLQQCEQILQGIIQNYPNYQDLAAVQNNLKQIQKELHKN